MLECLLLPYLIHDEIIRAIVNLLEIGNWNFILSVTTANTQRKWDIHAFLS